jgi:hydroxylamine reductase (hybrid-cluster protein)
MKEIRKKSIDTATNEMLIKAHRAKTEVIWDRADAAQPQCGFGRMSICCTDCYEGPCRVNPFDVVPQRAVCGRTQEELVFHRFLKQVTDGTAALIGLAHEFRADVESDIAQTVYMTNDSMLAPADYTLRISEVGQAAAKTLLSIRAAKERAYGKTEPKVTTANLGVLKADAANVVLIGHIAPHIVQTFMNATSNAAVPFNITALCGVEEGGRLPVLTNYNSQEMPLLTGAVDLLVVGSQCVMPATVSLAKTRNVAVVAASSLGGADKKIKEAVQTALRAFQQRLGKDVHIPSVKEQVHTGYTAENRKQVFKALKTASARSAVKGVVYLGGCGTLANTQDASIVQLASRLLSAGYLIVTAGCAGAALAKAGMCSPEYASREGLKGILEIGAPAVLHIGSCHDAGEFLAMAQDAQANGIPVFSLLQEISHNKVLATAIAFAAKGIKTYVDLGETTSLPEMKLPGGLLLLSELEQLTPKSTNVVAAR